MRWILGAAVVLVVGMVFQLGLLVYAMYVLLGVLILSRYLTREWIENATADRECNRVTANVGEKAAVIVNIKNSGPLPIAWLLLEDSLPREALSERPPRLRVEGQRTQLMQLAGGGTKSMLYQVQFKTRGYYQIGPLLMETGDLFGLHRRYKVVSEPHFVLVYPKVVPLEGYDLASRRPIGEVRITHRLFEDPTRISGVRQYQHGDPLSRIHWRATARVGTLHSKTYEPSSVAGATLLLDFHRDAYPERNEPHRSELAITAVASLANTVYQLGEQVGFISNGRDAADRIRQEGWKVEFRTRDAAQQDLGLSVSSDRLQPVLVETRRGPAQFTHILESLARLEKTDGLTFAQLVTETSSRLPRDATVVAVLGEVTEETAITLGNLRRSGFAVTAVLVLSNDEREFGNLSDTGAGRLMAEGIDVRHIDDERGIAGLCSQQLV